MTKKSPASRSIRHHLIAGLAVVVLLAGALGGWAATAELAGAVIASGQLVVESNVKKVQHPTGGIVGELLVREGQHVKSGDLLLRLDETQTRANLAIIANAIDELNARKARLEAEKEGASNIDFPQELLDRLNILEVDRIVKGERHLFELRSSSRAGQKSQLKERMAQLENQIQGLTLQAEAKEQEIALIKRELEGVRELWKKNLIQINRLTTLEREAARLEGERGQLIATTAEAKGKIAEIELQIIQVDQDLRSQVAEELSEVRAKLTEFRERRVAAEDQLKRVDIRSPQDGAVLQLAVHTIGGVIAPGDAIMLIVPDADELTAEVRVLPNDIDQLQPDQTAILRLSAFNMRTTPELEGKVTRISADLTEDQRTGDQYYVVRLAIPDSELQRLTGIKLVPGMPVEAFIQTGERSVLSYLVKPLTDYAARAFRES
jgi:HlyD family secretion protein